MKVTGEQAWLLGEREIQWVKKRAVPISGAAKNNMGGSIAAEAWQALPLLDLQAAGAPAITEGLQVAPGAKMKSYHMQRSVKCSWYSIGMALAMW